ncbi:MAG: quinone-dependent dihydroorotate dehydrogenase [Myxococcales bacterium]|nr:quinone-dependent dihydroorotate dehydrogenase [Myxococcales bacterium]
MYPLLRSALFRLPPEAAHRAAIDALALLGRSSRACASLRSRALAGVELHTRVAGLDFPNPLGLAAGMDKDAEAVAGFFGLGFGFVEVGTLTPRAQPGNPRPRLFRIAEHRALINRLGFNNLGAGRAAQRLAELDYRPGPVGANIGKNRDTPLERAAEDYLACVDALGPLVDYVVLNASSPNTPGLRSLQEPEALAALLAAVRPRLDRARGKKLFLKISPDLSPEAIDAVVDVAATHGADGLVATNTTIARPLVHPRAAEGGGLSGEPLRQLATQTIRRAYERSGGRLPIIGVGGVSTGEHAYEKLRAGASLVQLYTGLVFEGPSVVRRLLRDLARLLERDGFGSVAEAVGADSRSPSPGTSASAALRER